MLSLFVMHTYDLSSNFLSSPGSIHCTAQIRKYTLLDMKFNQIGQQVNLKFLKDSKVNCAIPNYDWEFFVFNLQPVEISQVH